MTNKFIPKPIRMFIARLLFELDLYLSRKAMVRQAQRHMFYVDAVKEAKKHGVTIPSEWQ